MRTTVAAAGSSAFVLAAPGVVAGPVPWWLTGSQMRQSLPYSIPLWVILLIAAGSVVLISAFVRFVRDGAGTPARWRRPSTSSSAALPLRPQPHVSGGHLG